MIIQLDFENPTPLYIQLKDQIIAGIADGELKNGQKLPAVRSLAAAIGINMHTVNKVYLILQEEGYLTLKRGSGAVINCVDNEKDKEIILQKLTQIKHIAKCKGLNKSDIKKMLDEIF